LKNINFVARYTANSSMNTFLETNAGNYRWHENWALIPDESKANGRTHGVAVSKDGSVIVFHQASPGVLIYSPEGKLLSSWGDYPGAHGLTLVEEEGVEFLWLTDQETLKVEKTTLAGEVVQSIPQPPHPAYAAGARYVPTWVAVNEVRHGGNGDIWVADGYGSNLVHRFGAGGNYLGALDGTEGEGAFACPHGIAFDTRKSPPQLYVADRGNHRAQVYDANGCFLRAFGAEFFTSPDGFVVSGNRLIVPELFGRVTILDADDQRVDSIGDGGAGGNTPGWPNKNRLEPGTFSSPHGAGADADGNLFVVEWRLGGRIIKLEKV